MWGRFRDLLGKLPEAAGNTFGSEVTYVFVPEAATDEDVSTGDQQAILASSSKPESCQLCVFSGATAPTGANGIFELEYNANGLDLDSVSWTRIIRGTVTAGQKGVTFDKEDFTTLIIPRRSLLRLNLDQVGSTVAGQNWYIFLFTKRLLI